MMLLFICLCENMKTVEVMNVGHKMFDRTSLDQGCCYWGNLSDDNRGLWSSCN